LDDFQVLIAGTPLDIEFEMPFFRTFPVNKLIEIIYRLNGWPSLINFAETVSRQDFHEKIHSFDMIKTPIRWFEMNPIPP